MIVVLGRPALDEAGALEGIASRICVAAAAAGAAVEVVGTVADDESGDGAVVALGRAGVGHAALLRIPEHARRLEAADIELALRYLPECRVVVIAEDLDEASSRAAIEGAAYHRAQLVILGGAIPAAIEAPAAATVLTTPEEDAGAFSDLVGRYAALLDGGSPAQEAWRDAITATGWEHAPA